MAHYCKWDDHCRNLLIEMENMKTAENYVDATIVCEGQSIKVHKLILSTCSALFHNMFQSNPCSHPIIILQDVKFSVLQTLVNFMYRGEVAFETDEIDLLLKAAKTLEIKGLNSISKEMFFGSEETNIHEGSESNNITNGRDCSLDSSPSAKRVIEDHHDTGSGSTYTSNLASDALVQVEECVEFDPQISEICSFSVSAASSLPANEDSHFSTPQRITEEISTEKKTVSSPNADRKRDKSYVWKYFTPIDKFNSECNLCPVRKIFATNLSNLKRHLRMKHLSIYQTRPRKKQKYVSEEDQSAIKISSSSDGMHSKSSGEDFFVKKRSLVWNYFTPLSETSAQCKICLQSRHYGSTTSNLARHIRLKHPSFNAHIIKQKQNGDSLNKPEITMKVPKKKLLFSLSSRDRDSTGGAKGSPGGGKISMGKKKSHIWNYFTPLDSSFAQCQTCFVRRFYGTTISNLKRHLKLKHPSILGIEPQKQIHSEVQNSEEQVIIDEVQIAVDGVQHDMNEETGQEIFDTAEGLTKEYTNEVESSLQEIRTDSPLMEKKTSYLWKYFTPLNKRNAVCNICKIVKPYQSSISNLKKHMLKFHPSIKLPYPKQNFAQQSIKDEEPDAKEETLKEDLDERNNYQPECSAVETQLLTVTEEAAANQEGVQEVTLQMFDKVAAGTLHRITGETLQEITLPTSVVKTESTHSGPYILKFV